MPSSKLLSFPAIEVQSWGRGDKHIRFVQEKQHDGENNRFARQNSN